MHLRTLAHALVLASLACLAGCDDNPAEPSCTFTLSATSISIGATGGPGSVSITAGSGCSWTASSGASWITATGATSGTGSGTVAFTAAANTGSASRTGSLTVAGQAVSVTQQGVTCSYALQPASRTVDAAGATATFDVTTDAACSWTATPTVPWLTVVSGGSGSGNTTVTYRVAANPDAASRTGSLNVGTSSHVVTQTGLTSCTVDLSRSGDSFSVAGGSGSFEVTAPSSCAWVAVSNASWVRVTEPAGGAGTGSRRVSFSIDANPDVVGRNATVSVGSKAYAIAQSGTAGCSYSVTPVDVRACMAEGFARTISIATGSGCPWTASTPASWVNIGSGLSGAGPGTISYTLGSNYDAARQTNIEVRWPAPTAGQNVRVAQAGCLYGVSIPTFDVPAAGGDFTFDVVSQSTDTSCGGPLQNGCMWSAVPSASWVTILSSMPRYGDDRVSFRVASNTTGSARTTTIVVRDKTIDVRQAGS